MLLFPLVYLFTLSETWKAIWLQDGFPNSARAIWAPVFIGHGPFSSKNRNGSHCFCYTNWGLQSAIWKTACTVLSRHYLGLCSHSGSDDHTFHFDIITASYRPRTRSGGRAAIIHSLSLHVMCDVQAHSRLPVDERDSITLFAGSLAAGNTNFHGQCALCGANTANPLLPSLLSQREQTPSDISPAERNPLKRIHHGCKCYFFPATAELVWAKCDPGKVFEKAISNTTWYYLRNGLLLAWFHLWRGGITTISHFDYCFMAPYCSLSHMAVNGVGSFFLSLCLMQLSSFWGGLYGTKDYQLQQIKID